MKKVLLAEDDLQLMRMYQIAFENSGLTLVSAFNGEEALVKAKEEKPDLILLDIVMPKMNGVLALQELKSDPTLKDIPVFMLTVLHQDEDIAQCKAAGAEEFLIKSDILPDDVIKKVLKRLGVVKSA